MATIGVTVLTPHGRRETVKVTPNSTILQILEEVCKKYEFDPLEYDIRHHSKILDTTMTMQFSRLPNNAQLEMVKAKKIRRESEVLVNVQMESGDRLSGTFLPSESLGDVVSKLCSDVCSDNKQPTILYMRQEICGMENLKETTLRNLGITSGRALLRFMCKVVEGEVPKQPGVTSARASYSVASSSKRGQAIVTVSTNSQNIESTNQRTNVKRDLKDRDDKDSFNVQLLSEPSTDPNKSSDVSHVRPKEPQTEGSRNQAESHEGRDKVTKDQFLTKGKSISKEQHTKTEPLSAHGGVKHKEVKPAPDKCTDSDSLEKLLLAEIEPRDRNAVVFKHGTLQPATSEDLPEEFFELTIHDVHNLYRDLRNYCTEVDESPLQTSAVRELEGSKAILNKLHKYKRTVLRIQFPDQIVLQGSFSPVETIRSVEEFVQGYLQDPSISFYLYTTPPKEILSPSSRLIEVNCVPCALLYFGLTDGIQESTQYLRADVLDKLSSPEEAVAAATMSRGLPATSEKQAVPSTGGTQESCASTSGTQQSCASTSGVKTSKDSKENSASNNKAHTISPGGPNGKVPKWFKLGPK